MIVADADTPDAELPKTESTGADLSGADSIDIDPPETDQQGGVANCRNDFPILNRCVHGDIPIAFLDNAASAQRPRQVLDAMNRIYEHHYANVHRGIHVLSEEATAAYEHARADVAKFMGAASSREVIFTAGTTAAINLVAHSFGGSAIGPGDVVLVTIADHHANIVPWHQLAERTGCRVEFLDIDDAFLIDDSVVKDALHRHNVKMFAFVATSNVLGTRFPVRRWTKLAHDAGATVLVDAAQAAPAEPIDVQQWDADFVVFSGHKVSGPTGIGVLYGRERLLESMPPFMGGGGMIHRVTTDGFSCAELPDKFEAGTPPIVEAIGLAAAVNYLSGLGMENIHRHERFLAKRADAGLRAIDGVRIVGPTPEHKSGIVSFHMDRPHSHDVAQLLDGHGIAVRAGHHCTMPLHERLGLSATTRASFYAYNTIDEVDRLVDAVGSIRQRFSGPKRQRKRRG